MHYKNIALFCASSNHIDPTHFADAQQLGGWIGEQGRTLVYGGAALGLMEATATAVKESGGEVIGVMPEAMIAQGRGSELPHRMIVVETLPQRKEVMMELADAFVALAGGVGTLDELFDVLAAAQLSLHHKPLILCNTLGVYTPLVEWLAQLHKQGLSPQHLGVNLWVVENITAAIALIEEMEQAKQTV